MPTEEAVRQVRVPLSDILSGGGSITMDDVHDAADGGDDAVTHFMAAEQAGPRVDAEPGALLGEDMRPIQPAQGQVDQPSYGAPVAPEPPQSKAVTNDPMAPQQEQRSRNRLSPTTRFNEKYRYSNQDFYGERGPDIYSADALGEKLYVPRAGELPMGLFASYAQTNQQQRGEIKKSIADLLAGTKNLETADPYKPAFTKLVTDWQNNFVAGIAEQYGGNQDLAWRETATPGTAANKAYLDGMAAMDALGQFVKFQWGDAQEYIKQVMDGKINTSPEQKQRAIDVFYGIGNLKGYAAGGDFMKLVGETEALKRDMNTLKWINEEAQPAAAEAYKALMEEPIFEMIGGKRFVRRRTKEEVQEALYPFLAKQGSAVTGVEPSYLEEQLRVAIPKTRKDTYDLTSAEKATPSGGSDEAETGTWYGEVEVGVSPTAEAGDLVIDEYGMENALRGEVQKTKSVVDRIAIGEKVSKRKQNMGPRKFTDAKGNPVEMRPQYIERDASGRFYIVGRPVVPEETDTFTQDVVTEEEVSPGVTKKTTRRVQDKPQPEWISVPVSVNEAAIDGYMGSGDWRKAFGAARRGSPAQKKNTVMTGASAL